MCERNIPCIGTSEPRKKQTRRCKNLRDHFHIGDVVVPNNDYGIKHVLPKRGVVCAIYKDHIDIDIGCTVHRGSSMAHWDVIGHEDECLRKYCSKYSCLMCRGHKLCERDCHINQHRR